MTLNQMTVSKGVVSKAVIVGENFLERTGLALIKDDGENRVESS